MRADPPPLSFFHARSKPTADGAHYLGAAVDDGGRTFDGAGMEALRSRRELLTFRRELLQQNNKR